jgi:hypothetical protein
MKKIKQLSKLRLELKTVRVLIHQDLRRALGGQDKSDISIKFDEGTYKCDINTDR